MGKADTKTHILDTASDLFWSKSYHGVNMNELSQAAGVNKATIYQHFSSKEELAVASIARAAELTEETVYRGTFAEVSSPKDRLEGIYQKVFHMHDEQFQKNGTCRGCPFVNIGVEMSTTSDAIRSAVNRALASFHAYYIEIIDDLTRDGPHYTAASKQQVIETLMANMNACQVASKLENRPGAILDGKKRALRILAI